MNQSEIAIVAAKKSERAIEASKQKRCQNVVASTGSVPGPNQKGRLFLERALKALSRKHWVFAKPKTKNRSKIFLQKKSKKPKTTAQELAEKFGLSERTLKRARRVLKNGSEALVNLVVFDKLSLNSAEDFIQAEQTRSGKRRSARMAQRQF